MGRWVQYENTYRTMDLNYMESVIWSFKQLYDKNLIYEGVYSIWYSYAAESTVSISETRQDDNYRMREDTSVTVAFELNEQIDNIPTYILAWTTTPWTLVSNFALCVGEDIDYAILLNDNKYYIIGDAARSRYKKQFEQATFIRTIKGKDLIAKTYKPLFDFFTDTHGAFQIVSADYVTTENGTGIVHLAPFGEEDLDVMRNKDISWYAPVNEKGLFTNQVGKYAGMLVFDAIDPIISDLKESGHLIKKEQYRHMYPHCGRTGCPLINMPLNSWYVNVPKFKDYMVELNKNIDWIPNNIRDGQMGKWLEGSRPWAISRSRFFGAPLPVWKSDNPKYPRIDVYGSLEELKKDFNVEVKDLHRPFIDELTRPNPDDPTGQSTMRRIPDVLDCWFESGAVPFASKHYPFENKEWFEKNKSSEVVVEYLSQTRGWFYNLMNLSTALFGTAPFKRGICHGVVVDAKGQKLSKSKRNYPDPMYVIDNFGSDSLRWFLMSSTILSGGTLSIDTEGKELSKSSRQVILPLWSAYYFFTLFANAGNITAKEISTSKNILDKYILSKLKVMIESVTEKLDSNQISDATIPIIDFIETLNNWYIRLNRSRFWDGKDDSAFNTLYTVLTTLCKVLAPYLPMISEHIYRSLTGEESVHLCDWPKMQSSENTEAENQNIYYMDTVKEICSIVKNLREDANIKIRQPIADIKVISEKSSDIKDFEEIITSESNAKQIIYETDISKYAEKFLYIYTPIVGKKLGAKLPTVIAASKKGEYKIINGVCEISGEKLMAEEFEERLQIKDGIQGKALPDNSAIVIINTEISDELKIEGIARDFVRMAQDERKTQNLNVSDRIKITFDVSDSELETAIAMHKNYIQEQTLCIEIVAGSKFEIKKHI
jgi:isoleucyl-tRNA synthetase